VENPFQFPSRHAAAGGAADLERGDLEVIADGSLF
jgi:hypothetical protein